MEIKSLHPIRKACSYNVSGPSVLVGVVFSTGKLGPVSHLGVGEVQCINIDIFPMLTMQPASSGWNSAATTVSVEHLVSVIFTPRSRDQSHMDKVGSVPSSTDNSKLPPS